MRKYNSYKRMFLNGKMADKCHITLKDKMVDKYRIILKTSNVTKHSELKGVYNPVDLKRNRHGLSGGHIGGAGSNLKLKK